MLPASSRSTFPRSPCDVHRRRLRRCLPGWQRRHAVLVLSKAKGLGKIRYDLCPRHMKDKLYFLLAKSYTLPYELRAIQKEKVRRMETENGKPKDLITVEVEMQESKCSRESQTSLVDPESEGS